MAVTPQTNVTLQEFAEHLMEYDSFVLCGHVSPDGDCIGSQLALSHALRSLGKKTVCVLAQDAPIEPGLRFLPGVHDMVPACRYDGEVQAFVACDVPNKERIKDAVALQERAQITFTVDHHAVDDSMSVYNYVDPDAPAVGMLVWDLAKLLVGTPDSKIATCCYTALMTDTGRFQYQNTNAEAFAYAAEMVQAGANPAECSQEAYQSRTRASFGLEQRMLEHMTVAEDGTWAVSYVTRQDMEETGSCKADAESLIDTLRSLGGIRAACVLREQDDGIRGSLRAKDDQVDVSAVARSYEVGGGHKAAAGFTYFGDVLDALADVSVKLADAVKVAGE